MKIKPNDEELQITKQMLVSYSEMKAAITLFKKNTMVNEHNLTYTDYLNQTNYLELALDFTFFKDEYTKKMLKYRFFEGYSHKITIGHFGGIYDVSTIDRKIKKGIGLMASSLITLGYFKRDKTVYLDEIHINNFCETHFNKA